MITDAEKIKLLQEAKEKTQEALDILESIEVDYSREEALLSDDITDKAHDKLTTAIGQIDRASKLVAQGN